jgi:hypothetical protein
MTAYSNIFDWQFHIVALLLCIASQGGFFFRSPILAKSILVSLGPWLGASYYFLFLYLQDASNFSVYLAFIIEVGIIVNAVAVLNLIINRLRRVSQARFIDYSKLLKNIVITQIIIFIFMIQTQDFGIFSQGSRIQFLEGSRLNLYLTYISSFISNIGLVIVALIFNKGKKFNVWPILYLSFMALASVLAGSKGSSVLGLIVLLCYVDLKKTKIIVSILSLAALSVYSTLTIVGSFLRLNLQEMAGLIFVRIFLANDARALSIDLSSRLNSSHISLFQESFRSFYSFVISSPPVNLPLGLELSKLAFSRSDSELSGPNSSATALLIAYGGNFEKIIFMIVILSLAVMIYLLAAKPGKYGLIRSVISLQLLNTLSQDFLAFQLYVNIFLMFLFIRVTLRYLRFKLARAC